jgi:hypothetical protein
MLILSPSGNVASKYVFHTGPSERDLTDTLTAAALKRRWKRIAVLRPSGGKADSTIESFKASAKSAGIEVPFDISYASINYSSMQGAVERLFQIDLQARKDEFQKLVKSARDKAVKDGVPFNPKAVFLPPIVEFDAVFLPDDYRVARHMVRIFKYFGARNVPFIGNQEWRSPALVNPREPLLDGSMFGDVIGRYEDLPTTIRPATIGGAFFADPTQVTATDGGMIGYRAGDIILGVLAVKPSAKLRSDIATRLPALRDSRMTMFQGITAFGPGGASRWPASIFAVSSDQITLLPP